MRPAPSTSADERWMRRAIELAERAGPNTRPNPPVGCVLVRDDTAIGEGFHRKAGLAHAEIEALNAATEDTGGTTAYVTLEPCNHQGRTGPCAEALIDARVARVVIGCPDPNPSASGGVQRLKEAGIAVTTGVLRRDCERVAEVFLTNIRLGRPHIRLKLAATLDGRTAALDGSSQWITGDEARTAVHALRRDVDAVMVGSGTVISDNPNLNVRHVATTRQPTRVVLDRRLRVSTEATIAATQQQPTMLFTTLEQRAAAVQRFAGTGVSVVAIGDGGVRWLHEVCAQLLKLGVHAVLSESGPTVAAALLRAGLVDRIDLMVGGKLLGAGAGVLHGLGINTIDEAIDVEIDDVRQIGADAWLSARVGRGK